MGVYTCVKTNGVATWIRDFKIENGVASGAIHGRQIAVPVQEGIKISEAKRAMVTFSNEKYGTDLCDYKVRGRLSSEARLRNKRVTESRIEDLGNGVSRGTAKVDGTDVSVLYTGTVTNDRGEVMSAKPWLGDFRKDAIKAKEDKSGKVFRFPDRTMVDNEFIQMLINKKSLRVEKGVVFIGSEKVKIRGMKKLDAAAEIKAAIDRYNEEQKRLQADLDVVFASF